MELVNDTPTTPWSLFDRWFVLAQQQEVSNPEAMSLATVGADNIPQIRTVLMKQLDPKGVLFFTNSTSTKGQNIAHNAEVALLFYWRSLDRQVRINGRAMPIGDAESDAYFKTRSVISKVGAWASQQSQPMADFSVLQKAVSDTQQRFDGQEVPRPPHWFGYRVQPHRMEYWIQEKGRLHQRIAYSRTDTSEDVWDLGWLFP